MLHSVATARRISTPNQIAKIARYAGLEESVKGSRTPPKMDYNAGDFDIAAWSAWNTVALFYFTEEQSRIVLPSVPFEASPGMPHSVLVKQNNKNT